MPRPLEKRDIEFRGTPGGALERVVRRPDGKTYAHRCSQKTFEAMVIYIDDHQHKGVKVQSLPDAIGAPMTQVNVAIQLLLERSLVENDGRTVRIVPGYAEGFYEHAMIEFLALIEGCPPQQRIVEENAQAGSSHSFPSGKGE